MSLFDVRNVCFEYAGQRILDSVMFTAARGEFIVLTGVNGAGKSTLLDLLAGLRPPSSGTIVLANRDLSGWSAKERSRMIGHLPQIARRDLPFTVEQIVLMGRYSSTERWFESDEDRRLAEEAMRQLDCLKLRNRRYETLSGGEQQRVLLAACIAQTPSVLLFDEPATYLDVHQQLQCFSTLAALAHSGALCIAVAHDLNLALAYSTRLLILHNGRIAADILSTDAAADTEWLKLLSPRLMISRTQDGRHWVLYR